MKKKYLTYAGIISAITLIAMFITIFFIKSPILLLIPIITIEPVTEQNVDDNNFLILSGKTNLPEKTQISISVYPLHKFLSPDNKTDKKVVRGDVWITRNTGEWNFWNGTIDISPLEPGEYQVIFKTVEYVDNFTRIVESEPIASFNVMLGDDDCTGECIRKKVGIAKPFIRINPVSEYTNEFGISGITSLKPGTSLIWMMEEITGTNTAFPARYEGNSTVIQGIEGIYRWSFLPDTNEISPGFYRIMVTTSPGDLGQDNSPGNVSASQEFEYLSDHPPVHYGYNEGSGPGNNTSMYVTIDALPEMYIDDKYDISGTTNLPPGELLYLEVAPPNLELNYNFTFNPRDKSQGGSNSGIAGCTDVIKGNGRENFWTFIIQTYSLLPGRYEMNVGNSTIDPITSRFIPGPVNYSEEFLIHGGSR